VDLSPEVYKVFSDISGCDTRDKRQDVFMLKGHRDYVSIP